MANPKKILFIGHDASLTGAPKVLYNLIKWISENRSDLTCYLLLKQQGQMSSMYESVCKVFYLNPEISFLKFLPGFARNIIHKSYKWNLFNKLISICDIVYSNTITNGEIIASLVERKKLPLIVHVHEMGLTMQLWGEKNMKIHQENVDAFICVSNLVAANLHEYGEIENSKIHVINPFIEMLNKKNYTDAIEKPNKFIVGGAGAFSWAKGIEIFIIIANQVIRKRNDIDFIWVGGDKNSFEYKRFNHLLKLYEIQERVKIIPHLNDPFGYYNIFDIFLLTSIEDSFPLVCVENSYLEIPVIYFSNCTGISEMLEENAFHFNIFDMESIVNGICQIIDDPQNRIRIGKKAREKACEKTSIDRNARKIVEIINNY